VLGVLSSILVLDYCLEDAVDFSSVFFTLDLLRSYIRDSNIYISFSIGLAHFLLLRYYMLLLRRCVSRGK
jgi:hypothetical protein